LQPRPGSLLTRPQLPGESFGVKRLKERRTFVDDQGHASTKLQRAADESVGRAMNLKRDSLTFAAGVDGFLDTVGVELRLIGGRKRAVGAVVDGGEVRLEPGTEGRNYRLGYSAGVLGDCGCGETEGENRQASREPLHTCSIVLL